MGCEGKEIKLAEQTVEQTEEVLEVAEVGPQSADSVPVGNVPGNGRGRNRDRRERRQRRNGADPEASNGIAQATALVEETQDADQAASEQSRARDGKRAEREARREERQSRPRAPRAERAAAEEADQPDGAPGAPSRALTETEALVLDLEPDSKKGSRALARTRKKQRSATAALSSTGENPALGALNRHLNMLMQQLGTAHRVIGRIAAERDALRQQLADLQGVPVEEIKVTTIGNSSLDEGQEKSGTHRPSSSAPSSSSKKKFSYFTADDISVTRKRRLGLVTGILAVVLVIWYGSSVGLWTMPANVSRDSLNNVPFLGQVMPLFLAGWIFYRMVRIGSRGVRWVYPSAEPATSKRRRR